MRCSCRILRARTPWFNRAEVAARAFSSEVEAGSREENASKQRVEPRSDSIGTERALRYAIGQIIALDEVAEPRELPLELQLDRTRRPVALLGDDDFGLAEGELH